MKQYCGSATWISILMAIALYGCGKPAAIVSPDRTMEIRPEVKANLVHLVITDRSGKVLFREGTHASAYQRWSFEWVTDSKLLFRSSDIGPSEWLKQANGSWQRVNPLRKLSPDKRLAIYTWWHQNKRVAVSLLKAEGDADNASAVEVEFRTDIVVPDLVDCAEWDSNDAFRIKTGTEDAIWRRQADGSWKRVQ